MLNIKKISATSPVWSNVVYFIRAIVLAVNPLTLAISFVGIASTVFHAYEYAIKYQSGEGYNHRWYEDWKKSFGPIWQRIDMRSIYITFALFTGYASYALAEWIPVLWVTVPLALYYLMLDYSGTRRKVIVGIAGVKATILLTIIGGPMVIVGLLFFIPAIIVRQDAYTEKKISNAWHSLWHFLTALGWSIYVYIIINAIGNLWQVNWI